MPPDLLGTTKGPSTGEGVGRLSGPSGISSCQQPRGMKQRFTQRRPRIQMRNTPRDSICLKFCSASAWRAVAEAGRRVSTGPLGEERALSVLTGVLVSGASAVDQATEAHRGESLKAAQARVRTDSDRREAGCVCERSAVTGHWGQAFDACPGLLEPCADVLGACVKTSRGQSSDPIGAEITQSSLPPRPPIHGGSLVRLPFRGYKKQGNERGPSAGSTWRNTRPRGAVPGFLLDGVL